MTQNDMDLKLSRVLDGCPSETVDLFARLVVDSTPVRTVRQLADAYGLSQITLSSRFQRAGLPSLKRYVVTALLVRVAFALDDPRRPMIDAALALGFSSGQSFGRTIRVYVGTSASVWRRDSGSGSHEFQRFLDELVVPYLPALRAATLVAPLLRVKRVAA